MPPLPSLFSIILSLCFIFVITAASSNHLSKALCNGVCKKSGKAALKLGNPRINRITFHTFRHWKTTMEYHRTKDLIYVKEPLGHRSILSIMIYTQLVNFEEDEFTCKVAKSIDEVKKLVEAEFEYVCDYDGFKVFRKRK